MTPHAWIAVAVALGVLALLVLFLLCRPKSAGVGACIVKVETFATESDRRDWLVRVDMRFENAMSRPVNVTRVGFEALTPDGGRLEPKKVCGDKTRALDARRHAPDLAMKLPIPIREQGSVGFSFELFFSHGLRKFWPDGVLRVKAMTDAAPAIEAQAPVPEPEHG